MTDTHTISKLINHSSVLDNGGTHILYMYLLQKSDRAHSESKMV
ncbi:hypothetical protein [Bacillus sp. AK128]